MSQAQEVHFPQVTDVPSSYCPGAGVKIRPMPKGNHILVMALVAVVVVVGYEKFVTKKA